MKVTIAGASNFVDRMFESAGQFQWARELLQNAREAGAKRIEFGIEWEAVAALGVHRRTVADNGRGMDAPQLLKFFSTLGAGSKTLRGAHANFGVGAKIATLPWNPKGVVVISRVKGGKPAMIWIVLNRRSQDYELVEFQTTAGKRAVVEPMVIDGVDWSKVGPDWAREQGTVVVLLGDDQHPSTAAGHPRAGGLELRSLSAYLNERFWAFGDVDVRVAELRSTNRARWPRGPADAGDATRVNLRRIFGARHYAAEPTKDGAPLSGVVPLDGGRVSLEWYLWRGPRAAVRTYAREAGYIAIRYRGELYQISANKAHYRWFGISESAVQRDLTLVLEPRALADGWGIYPDQSRNRLMFQGEGERGVELPTARWAYEFAENLPPEIQEAVRRSRGAPPQSGHVDEELVRRLQQRFGAAWHQTAPVRAGEDDPVTGELGPAGGSAGPGLGSPGTEEGSGIPATTKPARPAGHELVGKGGEHGREKAKPIGVPRYQLAHREDFEKPWHLASWAPHNSDGPVVLINVDSPMLQEVVAYRQSLYPEAHAEEIAIEVHRAYADAATCKVAHAQVLTQEIPEEVVDQLYRSEEALTVALMGLISEEALIANRLRGKFRTRSGS